MKSASSSITSARSWPSSVALCAFFLASVAFGSDAVFEQVVRQARTAAAAPYQPNETALPEVLQKLNYDTYRKISFRPEAGLWRDDHLRFQVQFFLAIWSTPAAELDPAWQQELARLDMRNR